MAHKSKWQDQIAGCFGDADGILAGHEFERDRYNIMIKNAGTAGASRDDAESEMRKYLATKKARPEHVSEQLERFRDLLFEEASGLEVD